MATASPPPNHSLHGSRKSSDIMLQLENTLDRSKPTDKKPLPDIRKSKTTDAVHIHNDFLPQEVMLALTQPADLTTKSMVPSRDRALAVSTTASRKPPANVWNHKNRRDKLKHLTDQAVCFCGAGRDISFLYDVPAPEEQKPAAIIGNKDASKQRDTVPPRKPLELPNSLVPDEYHIVKNKGVIGLEYHESAKKYTKISIHKGAKNIRFNEDDYTTQPEDHEAHLTVFPSMKPTSRYEVMRLREVMEEMMEKAGVNDESLDSVGPTQMHNLIELIKKEQKIYNIIFHELIRQSTIECTERGELLAEIRQKYSDLLSKVPRQIRGLHDEVMAQRALDRRLTEELFRFKNQIVTLTNELTEVKEHDKLVTEQARRAQEDLRSALMESQKNASLLGEYHDLYELQRQRLEKLVQTLTTEKELWSTATYSLSIKVVEEGDMVTARRAYIAEKSWSKLAHHFAVLLSDKDTEVLTRLQAHMEKWRDLMESFHIKMKQIEEDVEDSVNAVKTQVQKWSEDFKQNCLPEFLKKKGKSKDGAFVKGPDTEKTKQIYENIKEWQVILQTEVDKFSGNLLLSNNDCLVDIEHEISGWTECGVEVFNRHRHNNEYPNDYKVMIKLNKTLREMCQQYGNRVTGENGVAKYIIQLNTAFEFWENKLVGILHANQGLPQSSASADEESQYDSTSRISSPRRSGQSAAMSGSSVATSESNTTASSGANAETKKVTFQGGQTQTLRSSPKPDKYSARRPTQFKDTKEGQRMLRDGLDISEWWKKKGQRREARGINKASKHSPAYYDYYSDTGDSSITEEEDVTLSPEEWMSFMEQLEDWTGLLDNCLASIGSVNTEDDKDKGNVSEKIDVHDMMRKAHMWCVTTNNSIDSEDSKYVEQVVQLHTQMVKWMVHILLRLAPDRPDTSQESIEQSLINSPPIPDLVDEARILFQQLDKFSLLIHRSCEDIVRLRTQDRVASGDDMAEKELNDLQGLKFEAYHWIYAACILIHEMTNQTCDYKPLDLKFNMNQFSKARTATSHVLDYMESRKKADEATSVVEDDASATSRPATRDATRMSTPGTTMNESIRQENSAVLEVTEPEETLDPKPEEPPLEAEKTEDGQTDITEAPPSTEEPGAKSKSPAPPTTPKPESRPASIPPNAGQTPAPPAGSRPGSGVTSKVGSKAGSRAGSRPGSGAQQKEDSLNEIEVIGRDDNTRPAILPEPSPDEPPPRPSSGQPMAVDSQKAYDALKTVQKLQVQLLETEERAQKAEESEATKSAELVDALQRLRALERQMEEMQNTGEPTPKPTAEEPSEEVAAEAPEPAEKETKKKTKSGRPASNNKGKKK